MCERMARATDTPVASTVVLTWLQPCDGENARTRRLHITHKRRESNAVCKYAMQPTYNECEPMSNSYAQLMGRRSVQAR